MILGCLITYNDFPVIRQAVESMLPWCDSIIAVDGKFCDFPGKEPYSTDGTLEYLRGVDKVNLILRNNLPEVDKRNLYLAGQQGDWYLHLDGDEELVGELPMPSPGADAYILPMKRFRPRFNLNRVRFFRHVPGIHYEGKHYWLKDGQGRTFALLDKVGDAYNGERANDCMLIHHEDDRPARRQSTKAVYYQVLRSRERKIREVL